MQNSMFYITGKCNPYYKLRNMYYNPVIGKAETEF